MSPVKESIARDIMRVVVWYPLRLLIISLPYNMSLKILRIMGTVHHFVNRSQRDNLKENLLRLNKHVDNSDEIVKSYLKNYYIDRFFIWIFPKLNNDNISDILEISGTENLRKAMQKKAGVVLVHGHFGPVHLPLVALSLAGYSIKQIGHLSDQGLSWVGRNVAYRLRMKYEQMIPAVIIPAGSYMRPVYRWLQQGRIIMITGDGTGTQDFFGPQAKLHLFGHGMFFPLGPYLLAQKTGSIIFPLFLVPGKVKPYRMEIGEAFEYKDCSKESALEMANQFVSLYESYIQAHPEFMHFLDRYHPDALINDV